MILGKTYFYWASIVIQLLLIWVNRQAPQVYPERIKNRFTDGIAGISIVLTGVTVTLFPVKAPIFVVAIVLLIVAISPPFVGLVENKFRTHGEQIFDSKRFIGHLASNVVGAAAAILFFAAVSTTSGLVDFTKNFHDQSAFNVVLPLSTVVVFAFLRWQQITDCPDIDELVKNNSDWESQIRGSSLTAGHQTRVGSFGLVP